MITIIVGVNSTEYQHTVGYMVVSVTVEVVTLSKYYNPTGEHDEGALRFMNRTHRFSSAGHLEIYLNGHWGTICSVGFGQEDATLACNQLGHGTYQQYGTVGELGYDFFIKFIQAHATNIMLLVYGDGDVFGPGSNHTHACT